MHKLGLAGVILAFSVQANAVELSSIVSEEQTRELLENSLVLQSAQVTYERAARELGVDLIDKTRISASANSTAYLADDPVRENSLVGSLNVTQPLTHQLSVGANLTTDEKTTLSVDYQPFANEWVTPQQTYSYEQAKITLEFANAKVVDSFASSLSSLYLAQMSVLLADENLALAIMTEASLNAAADLDDVSTDELLDAQRDTLSAEQNLLSTQMTLAEETLAVEQSFGGDVSGLVAPSVAELESLVQHRQQVLSRLTASDPVSESLLKLDAEMNYLESTANSIDTFSSDLTFSSSYEVEDQIFKAGVSINLSPSNWNAEKKLDSALNISMQTQEIEQEQAMLALQVRLQQQRVQLETESVQVAKLGAEQQQRNLEETRYLLELGERTALEVAEQQQVVSEANLAYIKALYSLMDAQQTLSRFFPS